MFASEQARNGVCVGYSKARIDEAIVEVSFEAISNCCNDSLSREIVTRFWRGEEKLRIDNFYGYTCIRDMINFSIFLCCSSSS